MKSIAIPDTIHQEIKILSAQYGLPIGTMAAVALRASIHEYCNPTEEKRCKLFDKAKIIDPLKDRINKDNIINGNEGE